MGHLTRFEITRLMSARALQISLGAPSIVKATKTDSVLDIVRKEFEKKVVPISVLREFPDGHVEKVEVN